MSKICHVKISVHNNSLYKNISTLFIINCFNIVDNDCITTSMIYLLMEGRTECHQHPMLIIKDNFVHI